jgi:putative flippase GtrA
MRERGVEEMVSTHGEESTKEASYAPFPRTQEWISTFFQLLRYCFVGGVNTGIDILALNVLLWRFPTHHAQILVAYNSVAYCCGAISSFCLNKYWTFRRTQRPTGKELRRFVISILLELVYSNVLVWLTGKFLQPFIPNPTLWGNATKLVTVVCGVVISYSLMRFWTFANEKTSL